jgi:hypothetical protein
MGTAQIHSPYWYPAVLTTCQLHTLKKSIVEFPTYLSFWDIDSG